MNYIIQIVIIVVQILIVGLLVFFNSYFKMKGKNLATKKDIGKITDEIESVKMEYKNLYSLSSAERQFYNEMIKIIENFLAEIKKQELNSGKGKDSLTKEEIMNDPELKEKYLTFINSANIVLSKAFVFLDEENYIRLKNAIDKQQNFAHIRTNLLDAMRKSIHAKTKLKAKQDSRNLNY